ncbi:MAG: C4-type zinc ribbon domain-containing protein [Actinomycetota bacterium]|nr:C4-type zinc ribbon domain-containing protein [Actinomycetota bacterium]
MKADPTRQQRLLDLQAVDTRLGQLDHRLRGLPEHARLEELARAAADLDTEAVRVRTALGDVQRELAKADSDVQLVRDRAARDRQRLDSGTGTSKDLQALQHELESLARRQGTLEDEELAVMERAEELSTQVSEVERRQDELAGQVTEVTSERDAKVAELQEQRAEVAGGRESLVADVGADLVALYDKIRASSGTGAAALVQRRCSGCQLEINAVELSRIRSADEDEVVRCEECRRILVRTPESGV